jgi:hypothetical protein
MIPLNVWGGAGNCDPSIVVVALGEPGSPVVCWALPGMAEPDHAIVAKKSNAINPRTAFSRMGDSSI